MLNDCQPSVGPVRGGEVGRNPTSQSPVSNRADSFTDPLVSELRSLAMTKYQLCIEARLMLEMAMDAQLGKPIDISRLRNQLCEVP